MNPTRPTPGDLVNRIIGWTAFAALVLTVLASNAAIDRWGVVPVGFGLVAPAAVYVVGLALIVRDLVHTYLGRWVAGVAIIVGALLTLLVAPSLAVASAVAYLASETVDLLIFDRTVERGWLYAVVLSTAVGIVVDSLVFLPIAFGSYEFLPGQLVGKSIAAAFAVCVLAVLPLPRRAAVPVG